MNRIIVILIYLLAGLKYSAHSEGFYKYVGSVNDREAEFSLCYIEDQAVIGSFSSNSSTFTLAGDNSRQGEIFMAVAYKGRVVAFIRVNKRYSDSEIVWQGSMRVEETGEVWPVMFSRPKAP